MQTVHPDLLLSGCHWFSFGGRKKRSTDAEIAKSDPWRTFFAVCMATKVTA